MKVSLVLCTIVISLLLLLSVLTLSPSPVDIMGTASNTSKMGYPAGEPSGEEVLDYEWPQIHGDSSFTRFSAGPAPGAPDVLWKTQIESLESYVSAFNGMVFVSTNNEVLALDKDTGGVIWNTTMPPSHQWPAVYKIDDDHLVVRNHCLDIKTGQVLWTSEDFVATTSYWSESVYSPEEELFYLQDGSTVQAWNFCDPSIPPTLAWETYVPGGGSAAMSVQYGDGKVFPSSYDAHQMALDARTGKIVWDTETKGTMTFSGSYYQGRFLKAGEHDNNFYCFNASNGEILWTFNPGTPFGYWVSGSAVAYGKVYELNKDGHLYALDVESGKLAWKYQGPGFLFWPGWSVVADGKVYATTGQRAAYDPYTGEHSESEFVCLDAYTGEVMWKLPIEAHAPRESVAVAYGNLYLIPGYIKKNTMNQYETPREVWAIGSQPWPMWRRGSENTGAGQSGPTNLYLRWTFTTKGGVVSSPSVVDGKVYVGSNDKNIYCIDALSGRSLWSFSINSRVKSSPAVAYGKVYVGPDDGWVYCLDAQNGSLLWRSFAGGYVQAHFDASSKMRSSPVVVDGKVYVGALDSNFYCLNATTGDMLWNFSSKGYITSSPAVSEGGVYFTSQEPQSGKLYNLNANNGSLVWSLDIPYYIEAERGTDMHVSPVVAEGLVFAASNKDKYLGINATTGEIEWTYITSKGTETRGLLVGSPAYHDGKLFFVDQFFIVCLDAKNGSQLWKSWIGSELYASPTYADGKIYVNTDRRSIYVLNATNGDRLSWFETESKGVSSPTIYNGRVYVGNQDWNIYCLQNSPVTSPPISLEPEKKEVEKGQSVTICGQIPPQTAYAPLKVILIKPDKNETVTQVTPQENGAFQFSFTPDMTGDWNVHVWCSGDTYLSQSQNLRLTVNDPQQTSRVYPVAVFLIIAIIVVLYLSIEMRKT